MSQIFKGDVTNNVVELNLQAEATNIGTPTVGYNGTNNGEVTVQVMGDVDGSSGFYANIPIKGLVIGTSCTTIGSSAFYYCYGLTGSLTIPDSVTSIGSAAFYNCSGLTGDLIIPDSVTSIGQDAFNMRMSTSGSGFDGSLTIGNSVTTIGSYAFHYCTGLTGSLTIPDSVTSIGSSAFFYCQGLSSLTIGNGVTTIGEEAFAEYTGTNNYSGDLIIPDSVTTIGSNAFYIFTGNFDKLVVGSGVTSIGSYAFGTNLTPVAYASCPASAFVGSVAFYYCSSLTTLYARDAVANGYTLGSQSFEGATLTVANWDNYPNPIPN